MSRVLDLRKESYVLSRLPKDLPEGVKEDLLAFTEEVLWESCKDIDTFKEEFDKACEEAEEPMQEAEEPEHIKKIDQLLKAKGFHALRPGILAGVYMRSWEKGNDRHSVTITAPKDIPNVTMMITADHRNIYIGGRDNVLKNKEAEFKKQVQAVEKYLGGINESIVESVMRLGRMNESDSTNGRDVTEKFLKEVKDFLKAKGYKEGQLINLRHNGTVVQEFVKPGTKDYVHVSYFNAQAHGRMMVFSVDHNHQDMMNVQDAKLKYWYNSDNFTDSKLKDFYSKAMSQLKSKVK